MARYAEKEVRFNVMAIVGDRLEALERRSERLTELRTETEARLSGGDPGPLTAELPQGHEELQVCGREGEGREGGGRDAGG